MYVQYMLVCTQGGVVVYIFHQKRPSIQGINLLNIAWKCVTVAPTASVYLACITV